MQCYLAKAIYHVKAATFLLALHPASPIITYTEGINVNMKTVQLWTALQRVQGHGDRQTPDYCTTPE